MADASDETPGTAKTVLGVGTQAPTANLHGKEPPVPRLVIPGYRVEGIIGEGGMGTVYSAEQESPRRRVAIKVLESRSRAAWVRFQTEAEVMARLDHPGIARVLEAGEAEERPFLVMEHVEGVTLDKRAKQLPLRARLELFVAICDAVHHAHVKGVIHRDLKPANVMVRENDRVVVLDFGVARLAEPSTSSLSAVAPTLAGELIGTPLYMSPEQARAKPDEIDARTDIYSLGVILYELACGKLPYVGDELPLPMLTVAICEDPPVPLSDRDATLPRDLDAITHKALAKASAERYQSVVALGDDVRRHLDGLPVSVRLPSAAERFVLFVRRRPLLSASIAAAVLAAATFAIVVTFLWRAASTARADAEDARARTELARQTLERENNQLVLRQARGALARDPTEALAWLATLTPLDVDAGTAWSIANEALARGVAKDVVRGHTDEVHWVEPLTGGFVSGAYDGKVVVWDPAPRNVFSAAHGRVHAVRPSPDGAELAIGGDEGQLHVIARDGKVLAELTGHVGDVQHLAWSPDGAWLATGDDHGHLVVWPRGRAPGLTLETGTTAIGDLAFSADARVLVAGDHAGDVWRWELAALPGGARRFVATGADTVEVWTDGPRVAAVDGTGAVRTWHIENAGLVLERETKTGLNTKRAKFANDGSYVVLGGVGGAVTRVEGGAIEPLGVHRTQVRGIAISDDGKWIATGSDDGALVVHELATGRELALRGHTGRIRHVAFAASGELLSSDSDGVVRRWQPSAMPPFVLDGRGAAAERVIASADGARLAAVDAAGEVSAWTVKDARRIAIGKVEGRVTALAFAGEAVVTGTAEGIVQWWSAGVPPVRVALHSIAKSIAVTTDRVAVATASGPIAMFTLAGAPLAPIAGHVGGTETVAFDPSGALLASGGQDRQVRVWRREGDAFVAAAALDGPKGDTHYVTFADGWLVAAGNDGAVQSWRITGGTTGSAIDAASHRVLATHVGAITALATAPGWIASAGRDLAVTRSQTGDAASPAAIAQLAAAANALAIAGDGAVHAVTRTGEEIRWDAGPGKPLVEVDRGVADITRIDEAHFAEALTDGAIVIAGQKVGSLDELQRAIAKATTVDLAKLGRTAK